MGYREQGYVRDFTPAHITGAPYYLLLAMANHTTALGYVWASIGELSQDLRVSERTVQRTLRSLVDEGVVATVDWDDLPPNLPQPPRADRRPNLYRLMIVVEHGRGDNLSPRSRSRGDKSGRRGDKSGPRGDTAMSPNRDPERDPDRDPRACVREDPDRIGPSVEAMLDSIEADRRTRERELVA